MRSKSNYQIVTEDRINRRSIFMDLYVVEDFQKQCKQSIIVHESATGNGGYSQSNGRMQENLPLNGTLYADDNITLMSYITRLSNICDNGEPINLMTPFTVGNRSNKWYIENINFGFVHGGDNNTSFSMTLTEVREANVKSISVNLVNFETAQAMSELYNLMIGNV